MVAPRCLPKTLTVEHRLFLSLGLAITLATLGCGKNREPSGTASDARSESEYDLARDSWLRRGNPRDGLKHALKAIELDDENADAHHLTSLIYLDLCQLPLHENCRLEEAKYHSEQALRLKPDYREARNTLGVVLIQMKRPTDAITVLRPLTTDILYTTPEIAWGNLGWAYLESNKLDEAVEALERSVAAQPRFCVGFYRLAVVREKKGMLESAIEAYTSSLEADPRCSNLQDAYLGRAKAELALDRKDPARADLATCVQLAKDSKAGKECDSLRKNIK
jgi:Tfp pilus assembly protein PilF